MSKLSFSINTCSLNFFLVLVLCVAFTLVSIMSLLATPLTSHPLSMSWRFSTHTFLRGQEARNQKEDTLDLERVLRQTAMPDKTVIITTLNQAWATRNTMIDLFLESFSLGVNTTKFLNHLLIIALDQKSYDRCVNIHSHCFQLRTAGVDFSGEKLFMTPDYLNMMWRRIDLLRQILEEGYSFVFSNLARIKGQLAQDIGNSAGAAGSQKQRKIREKPVITEAGYALFWPVLGGFLTKTVVS
ncbi:hypothetical protein L7F22_029724 [Adiantum nelumboides]|nr:hypothetical protein [Adiantum nelumboides]